MNPLTASRHANAAPQPPPPETETLMNFAVPSSDSEDEFIFGRNAEKQAEAEMLSDYTDEDSLHSSGDDVIPVDHRREQRDKNRANFVVSVHTTIQHLETNAMRKILQDSEGGPHEHDGPKGWLHEVPVSAVALESSSLFVIPPRHEIRVVLYNLLHHWLFEVYLILLVVSNAVFQASWVRSGKDFQRPPFATWVDVFYLVAYILELLLRVVALGLVVHKGALLRDVWHWLDIGVIILGGINLADQEGFGNYTSLRLLRVVRSCALIRRPVSMKLFARTFLRSSRAVLHVLAILALGLFFFALLGSQVFGGALRHRCAHVLSNGTVLVDAPEQLCSPEATYWQSTSTPTETQWGAACPVGRECVAFPTSPNMNFFHFDNIGYALLAAFQISTNQGWSFMLRGTNDTVNTISFVWYAILITCVSWFLPGLILGIFMERADKTRAEYVEAQITRYDEMCRERRFDAIRATPIRRDGGAAEVDEAERAAARAPRTPTPSPAVRADTITRSSRRLETASTLSQQQRSTSAGAASQNREPPNWSSEMRVQLHLSLTRNRTIAEQAEADKLQHKRASSAQSTTRSKVTDQSSISSRPGTALSRGESAAPRAGSAISRLSHHRRLTDEFSFLDASTRRKELEERQSATPLSRPLSPEVHRPTTAGSQTRGKPPRPELSAPQAREPSRSSSASTAPPVHVGGDFDGLVEPNSRPTTAEEPRRSEQKLPTSNRYGQKFSVAEADPVKPKDSLEGLPAADEVEDSEFPRPSSTATTPVIEAPEGFEVVVVSDPEGGDLADATTCKGALDRMRCMVHMFTEGYPRILTQYLHDCRIAKNHGKTLDFGFQSIHEMELADAMKLHKKKQRHHNHIDDQTAEYEDEEAIKLSPHRMALSIVDNVSATWYNYVLVIVLVVNSALLASYHYPQTDAWGTAQWVIHFASNLFYLSEVLLRAFAMGTEIYCSSLMNLTDVGVVIIGFVELGLNRTNVITCLRLYRLLSFFKKIRFLRSLRKVSRVLWLCATDLMNLMIFLLIYVLLVVLYGMSLFGGAWTVGSALNNSLLVLDTGLVSYNVSSASMVSTTVAPFNTRGNFNTFSDAAFASMQAFSRVRDDWLLITWSAMSQKGEYTIIYFLLATMAASYVFQTLFIAVLAEGFEKDDAHDSEDDNEADDTSVRAGSRSKFFDFSLLTLLQRKTGGFARRKVAPQKVFELRTDMRNRIRTAHHDWERYVGDRCAGADNTPAPESEVGHGTRYPVLGVRDHSIDPSPGISSSHVQAQHADSLSGVVATLSSAGSLAVSTSFGVHQQRLSCVYGGYDPIPVSGAGQRNARRSDEVHADDSISQSATRARLMSTMEDEQSRMLLGPSLRVARRLVGGHWVPDRCERCGDVKQAPLKAPANTLQKTVDDVHEAQCDACAVRVAKLEVLTTILDYVRLQQQLNILPTLHCMETLLGQAWSCGLLLSENVDELCGVDPITDQRSWHKLLQTIEMQLWLLDLRIGQEQVGKFTSAYLLAYRREEAEEMDETTPKSFFLFRRGGMVRSTILDFLSTRWFEYSNIFVIILAAVMLACFDVLQTESSDRNRPFVVMDNIFTAWMTVEMILKCVAHGVVHPFPTAYLFSLWNVFDAFVVTISIASCANENIGLRYLKAFRVLHLFVFLQSIPAFRGVRVLCVAIQDAVRCFLSVGVFAALNYFVWACFALHIMGGTTHLCSDGNRTTEGGCVGSYNVTNANGSKTAVARTWYAPQNSTYSFDSFHEALLVMVEVSTGSSWMDVLYAAADSVGEGQSPVARSRPYLGLFFVAYYFVSGFVVLGLISALTVYSYVKSKSLFDGAAHTNPQQQLWSRIQAYLLAHFRPAVPLRPLGNEVSRVLHRVVMSRLMEVIMSLVVVAHMITMSIVVFGETDRNDQLKKAEYCWVALFIFETALRLAAHGPTTMRRQAHAVDATMVVLSIVQLGLESTTHHRIPFNVNTLRMLRIFRVAHAARFFPQARRLNLYGQTLFNVLPSVCMVTAVLCVCVFVFAVTGMHGFGGLPTMDDAPTTRFLDAQYNNYNTFVNSLLLTFRVVTFESWNKVLRDALPQQGCIVQPPHLPTCGTNWAALYFVVLVLFVGIVIVALYMGIVVEGYVTMLQMENSLQRIRDLYRFVELWEALDPDGTMMIPTNELHGIFRKIGTPLGLVYDWDRVEMIRLCQEYHIPDHHGHVQFHEVLLPMARRLLAWHLDVDPASISGAAGSMLMVSSLDVVRYRNAPTTVEHYFAATYALAAYRRKQAMRQAHALRRARWEEGRVYCDEHGLPYTGYGFQGYPLDKPFPEKPPTPLILQYQQRNTLKGLQLPEPPRSASATVEDQPPPPPVASAVSPHAASKRPPLSRPTSALPVQVPKAEHKQVRPTTSPAAGAGNTTGTSKQVRQTHHPVASGQVSTSAAATSSNDFEMTPLYNSAIDESSKRFGPSVPGAIHRNERRVSRLLRKQQQRLSLAAASNSAAVAAAAPSGHPLASPRGSNEELDRYQPPLGSEPSEWRTHESERRVRRRSTSATRAPSAPSV